MPKCDPRDRFDTHVRCCKGDFTFSNRKGAMPDNRIGFFQGVYVFNGMPFFKQLSEQFHLRMFAANEKVLKLFF